MIQMWWARSPGPVRRIQIASWIFLVVAGLIQAWFTRHRLVSDGISYLNIATYYARGDWHSALNSYWSPLYSWLLAALMLVLRPDPYWQSSLLHVINYFGYLDSLAAFEILLGELILFQRRHQGPAGLSETTLRFAGYSVFLVASLMLIDIGVTSPDMVAMALMFYLLHVLLRIDAGQANSTTYLLFGAALGLAYLCRSAFAPFIGLYVLLAGWLLWKRREPLLKRVGTAVLVAALFALPFIVALSWEKGRFTWGDAGRINYGWEIDGAARSTHWQGEPYDIGTPTHPTHKVFDHPAAYTFAGPVPGSYPPWYDPSYWYQGIQPRFEFKPQMRVFLANLAIVLYLLLRSPVTLPTLLLALATGWRKWLSKRGLWAYWFLLLPTAAYIFAYMLVFVEARYIAGSLVVLWVCLLASISIEPESIRGQANKVIQAICLIFAFTFVASRLVHPALADANDLLHLRESEWNLNWMLANRLEQMGLRPSDKIGWIGQPLDAGWPLLAGVKVVAEVPVIWQRQSSLFRRVYADSKEIDVFWSSTPEEKARIYQAFRDAGATVVIIDDLPKGADPNGWQRVLPPGTPHLTNGVAQFDIYKTMYMRRLAPAPAD